MPGCLDYTSSFARSTRLRPVNGMNNLSIADWIDLVTARLSAAGLFFGHGTDNARDEAAWLVLHATGEPLDGSFTEWGRIVNEDDGKEINRLAAERCSSRKPLAYLTGTAYFAGLRFRVNENVLVPRSPIAELILDAYRPWVKSESVTRMLDMCTGSGCIAIASAYALENAQVLAADICEKALQVTRANIKLHRLEDRVSALQSDLFSAVPATEFDLIVANPPYVSAREMDALPDEYRCEPGLGLASGADGLAATLQILLDAPRFLGKDGVLICEVGASDERLAQRLPGVPFLWLEFERGGSGVFLLTRQQLEEAGPQVAAITEQKDYVA